MQIDEFLKWLTAYSDLAIRLQLPSGEFVPPHFHVTEIGRVQKTFIDCGGTRRESISCLVQAWTANDFDHRLDCDKLRKIFQLAAPVLRSDQLPVEIEYGPDVASQYAVAEVEVAADALIVKLAGKKTDCLAKDKCDVGGCSDSACC